MPSFYDLQSGDFRGNCSAGATPPAGQGYSANDPTPGTPNPRLVDGLWVAGEPVPAAEPGPNWDGLNGEMLINAEWLAATNIVRGINPGLVEALPSAMAQLSEKKYTMFALLFNQICLMAEVPQTQREVWAVIGENYNMPAEFLDIVRGE